MNLIIGMANNALWLAGDAPGAIFLGVVLLACILPVVVVAE
jgi:hypothetical protein